MADTIVAAGPDMSAASLPSPEHHEVKPTIEHAPTKSANALTPPTSEEMNHDEPKQEPEESDLSDLDLDDDEEIEPDHYWDGGRIPVFKPTMDQFRSFKKFMEKIDKYGMKSGIVKVIPPQEWRDSLPALDEHVKKIKIKNPITQEFNGTFGTYTQQNVEKQRSYNLPEWKNLTESTQHQPPAKRGERRRNQEKVVRGGGNLRGKGSTAAATPAAEADDTSKVKRKPGRPRRNPLPVEEEVESGAEAKGRRSSRNQAATPASPAVTPADKKVSKPRGRPPKNAGPGQAKSVTSRRLNNTAEAVDYVDEAAFENFDYHMDDLDEYTPERCAELETQYWKSLAFNQPMYAADMPGSLFNDDHECWNVAKLENLLDVLGTKVPGVNTAYLYMGMWKATFAWHLEDVDLYSINYIHFGAPKQWYSISQEDARKFEGAMKSHWPVDSKNCDQFLRHKTYLISPDVLQKQHNLTVNKLVHYEGEFVITFPYGYHSGYNIGYNCAESVNFATESWLDFGRIAKKCHCEADNVWVDVNEIERKLRGEPTPEYIEETDDESDEDDGNLPTPPASVKGKAPRGKKRKRGAKEEEKPKKKKKIRIKLRVKTREPCCMCPNDNPWEPLLSTDHGKQVHRICALYTPETWIEKTESGGEIVRGAGTIDRARLDLKCNFCRSKRGACFQCNSKKCTRAFHATCAVAAGVLVDGGLVPTFGEDGTEYYEEGFDFRCRFHRPKVPKNLTVDMLENSKRLVTYGKELKFNDTVQAQVIGGEAFGGLVVENRPGEMSVVVDVLPDGERVEVEYKYLMLLNPDDSLRPKPSANAIPMPEGMNKQEVSVNNRQDGVPEQGQTFHDNPDFKFQDFYNLTMPPPGFVSKALQVPGKLTVEIDAADQLYFYLPKASTEAKCFFTDKAGSNMIAHKANFLDRVAPPPPPPPTQYASQRPMFQHYSSLPKQAKKQAIPRATPIGTGQFHTQPPPYPTSARPEKPYVYKPKDPAMPRNNWSVDPQSLIGQKNFLAEAARRLSQYGTPQSKSHSPYPGSNSSNGSTPAPFPREQYYSNQTLPAAFPGDYSGFRQASGMPTKSYVPNYQSVAQQKAMLKYDHGASTTSHAASVFAERSNDPPSEASRRVLSSDQSPHPPGYLENLQKYPYLLNSYLRRPKRYESPYAADGGYSSPYSANSAPTRKPHTPTASISSESAAQQWTPPSQVWDRAGLARKSEPINYHTPQAHVTGPVHPGVSKYAPVTYQTPHEFQHSFHHSYSHSHSLPSTASRDGAQARMMRDQGYGYGPYAPHPFISQQQRNSFGHAYDSQKFWNSPKAPTPSPISDMSNSGPRYGQAPNPPERPWAAGSQMDSAAMQRQSSAGYGPMLPQMGGGHD